MISTIPYHGIIERFWVEGNNKRSDRGALEERFIINNWPYFYSVHIVIFDFSQID